MKDHTPSRRTPPSESSRLISSLRELRASVDEARIEIATNRRLYRSVFSSFLKGIAYGLGALTAAVLVIPIILWFLSAIAWPPLIADFISDIITELTVTRYR